MIPHSYYHKKSFLLESHAFSFRNLLRGFLQGVFLKPYFITIIGLIISDLLFIVTCSAFYRYFSSKLLFASIILYSVLFINFNISLILDYNLVWIKGKLIEFLPDLEYILVALISAMSLLSVAIILIQDIK